MKVKDVLDVCDRSVAVYPMQEGDAKVPLLFLYGLPWESLETNFGKLLRRRQTQHQRAVNKFKYVERDGYAVCTDKVLYTVCLLNRNVESFVEFLDFSVGKIRSSGTHGGASTIELFVKEIEILDVCFKKKGSDSQSHGI